MGSHWCYWAQILLAFSHLRGGSPLFIPAGYSPGVPDLLSEHWKRVVFPCGSQDLVLEICCCLNCFPLAGHAQFLSSPKIFLLCLVFRMIDYDTSRQELFVFILLGGLSTCWVTGLCNLLNMRRFFSHVSSRLSSSFFFYLHDFDVPVLHGLLWMEELPTSPTHKPEARVISKWGQGRDNLCI